MFTELGLPGLVIGLLQMLQPQVVLITQLWLLPWQQTCLPSQRHSIFFLSFQLRKKNCCMKRKDMAVKKARKGKAFLIRGINKILGKTEQA